jgi:hypothetical protein
MDSPLQVAGRTYAYGPTKDQELANLSCDTLSEVIHAAWQGIQRVRQAWWLPNSFLRRSDLSV